MRTHDINELNYFPSISGITNYFGERKVPITVLPLERFADKGFVVAAYPYSGLRTIDVYFYVKYGTDWKLSTMYFYIEPKHRQLRVEERADAIILYDKGDELLSLKVPWPK